MAAISAFFATEVIFSEAVPPSSARQCCRSPWVIVTTVESHKSVTFNPGEAPLMVRLLLAVTGLLPPFKTPYSGRTYIIVLDNYTF